MIHAVTGAMFGGAALSRRAESEVLVDDRQQWLEQRLGRPTDKATLLEAVSNPDPAVRFWACRLLDHHELDYAVATRMLAAMNDQNKKVRWAALHTLGCEACKPDDSECFPVDVVAVAVEALDNDRSLRVRRAAAASLMFQRPMQRRVRRAFGRVLRDETDLELRDKAERALARPQ